MNSLFGKFKLILILFTSFSIFVFASQNIKAASLGERLILNIDSSYDQTSRAQAQAMLLKISDRANFYIDDNWWTAQSLTSQNQKTIIINNLATDFDNIIYPKLTSLFGSEWNPGIDNDPRINVFLLPLKEGAGGYFNQGDEYLKTQVSTSNEREIIYLNANYLENPRLRDFLTHEFQHLITFYQKDKLRGVNDDVWLNEARSEYAVTAAGFDDNFSGSNLDKRLKSFLEQPYDSLTEWQNSSYDYAPVNLIMQYLTGRFGQNIVKENIKSSKTGIEGLNEALANLKISETFSDTFVNWTVANVLNECQIAAINKFCYSKSDLNKFKILPTTFSLSGNTLFEYSSILKDWSWRPYQLVASGSFASSKNLKIDFQTQEGVNFRAPFILTDQYEKNNVGEISLVNGKGTVNIPNWGTSVTKLTLIPSPQTKQRDFSSGVSSYLFSWTAKVEDLSNVKNIAEGSLVKTAGDSKVYLIENGQKRWLTSGDVFISRFFWDKIKIVSVQDISVYPDGADINTLRDGALAKEKNSPKVYVISGGKKYWLTSALVFNSLNYQWSNILEISDTQLLSRHPDGANITDTSKHLDGALVKGSGDKVYLLENNQKRWITSASVFENNYFKWQYIINISDAELEKYVEGAAIVN